MRIVLALPLLLIALSGCLGGEGTDEAPATATDAPRSPGQSIGRSQAAAEEPMPENATLRTLDNSFGLVSSGSEVAGTASINLNAQTCVIVGANLPVWQPVRLNVTATWAPVTSAAQQLTLSVDNGKTGDAVTGTSPLHLQLEGFDSTDASLLVAVDEADNGVTVEQEITLDVRLEYEASSNADARTGSC